MKLMYFNDFRLGVLRDDMPDALPLEMAAAAVFHGSTAHYLVHDVGRLGPGTTCLVHAASGGIGQILIQLAKRLGAQVFATTSHVACASPEPAPGSIRGRTVEGFIRGFPAGLGRSWEFARIIAEQARLPALRAKTANCT